MKEWLVDKKFWIKEVHGDGSWFIGIILYILSRFRRFYLKYAKGIEITSVTTSTEDVRLSPKK